MESSFAIANGVRLHYHCSRGAGPPLVLAHGVTDSGLCWWPFIRKLEGVYDLILYDARGHGLSDKPAEGYDIRTMAEDLVGLTEALDLEHPILMGHSMGGATAAVAAANRPALPRAVVLEDPVHMTAKPKLSDEFMEAWHEKIVNRNQMSRRELIEHCKADIYPDWPDEEYEPWALAKQQVTPRIIQIFHSFPLLLEVFPHIAAPTLILRADGDEERKRKDLGAASLLGNGTLIHVAGAGHNVRRDRPETTLEYLRAFLDAL